MQYTKNNCRGRYRRAVLAVLSVLTILLVTTVLILSPAAEGIIPISVGGAVTTSSSTTESQPHNSTSVGSTVTPDRKTAPAVSYGLRVLAERQEMVFSGLCGNEISFSAEDIRRAMNLSELSYITVAELPEPGEGTLFVGSVGAAKGQVISAGSLHLVSFSPAREDRPSEATLKLGINGSDYAVTCHLYLLERLNYTPTVSLAPAITLDIETYRDLPTAGIMSAYDPEGDEITFEIARYASHGRVVITDPHTGAYVYTPDAGYTGQDSFSYVVRDLYGNYSTSVDVTIRVKARPAAVTYADIDGVMQAGAILDVSSMGLMNGTKVGSANYFKPTESISRVEFLVTAMQAAGIEDAAVASLGAPSVSDWESIPAAMRPYVNYALQKCYLSGRTEAGKLCFGPNEPITRAEAAVILSNIIGYATEDTVTAFADADATPAWSMQALTSLRALGVLEPLDGNANASDTMTRADTAAWLSRTVRLMSGVN